MKYQVRIEDAKLGKTKIDAEDIEKTEERARRWVLEGDWSRWGREEFVAFTIEDKNGVEWLYDQAVAGFAEPDCADGRAHVWKAPHELVGGSKSCPGTFRHSDIQYRFEEVYRHCGRYRRTISAGGAFLGARSTYRKPDDKSHPEGILPNKIYV